ncbi:hypothetical protein ACFTY8_31920 [Streptomyces mirabilis]
MPRDVREWLPPEHLCWKVLDVMLCGAGLLLRGRRPKTAWRSVGYC